MTDGPQEPTTRGLALAPDLAEVSRGRYFLAELARDTGFSEERTFDITVACSEAIANAIEHSPIKGEVIVRTLLYHDRLEVEIEGPGEFQAPDRLKERSSRGLGLPLMAKLSDHLALFSGPKGQTFVSLTFYRPGAEPRDRGAVPPSFADLSKENRLLDEVLKHLPDGFYVLDNEWRFIYVNPAVYASLGIAPDVLLGTVIWEAFSDFDPEARLALETAKAERTATRVVAHSGGGLWREWTAFPVDEGVGVFSRDITERKRAEEALSESEAALRGILDATQESIWVFGAPSAEILMVNATAARRFGKTPAEIVGKRLDEVIPAGLGKSRLKHVRHVARTGRSVEFEDQRAGMAFLHTLYPVFDGAGRVDAVVSFSRDITARKQAEEALQDARFMLTEAQAIAHVGSFQYIAKTKETIWSDEECRIYGLAPGTPSPSYEVMLAEFIHPDDAPLLSQTFAAAIDSRSVYDLEHRIVRPDGSVRVVHDRAHPYLDERGELDRYVGATVDVTEQRRAEERLAQQGRLLDLSSDAIFAWDLDGPIVYWNSGAERLYGFPAGEAIGKVSHDLLSTVHPQRFGEFRALLVRDGEWMGELTHTTKDGRRVLVETRQQIMTFGGLRLVLETNRDITERKRVEQELAANRERLEFLAGIVENASQPVAVGFADGGLGFFNRAYSDLLGYSEEELRSLDWSTQLTPAEWRDLETAKLAELQATGQPVLYEKEYVRKDGSRVPVELLVHLARDASGAPLYYFSFITDLRYRKRAEKEREQFLAEEQALNEELATANEELRSQTEELMERGRALQESEQRFHQALKSTPVSLAAMDLALRYIWAHNQRTATPDEVVGKTDKDLFPRQADRLTEIKRRVLETGTEAHEGLWIDRLGERMFLDLHLEPMRDETGAAAGLWITSVDLTHQLRAEEAARELSEQRQVALDAAKLGWWHYDPVSGISTWDRRYKEIFGVDEDARPNDQILARLHPDDLPTVWARVEAALDPVDPQPYSAEYRIFLPDGSMRWIEAHGLGIFEGDGGSRRATGLVGTVEDVTERKLAEDALQLQAQLLTNVIDPMIASDEDFNITYWNKAAERTFGWTAAEVVGRTGAEILRTEFVGSSREIAIEELLSSGVLEQEVRYALRDGTTRPFETHTALIRGSDGCAVGTISVMRDLSERKAIETTLQEQAEELAAINEELQTQTEELRAQGEALLDSEAHLKASDERSRLLLQVANAVAEWTDLDSVLDASLRAVVDVTSHARASIGLWDPQTRQIRVAASAGVRPMAPASAPLSKFSLAMQQAILTGQTVLVDYDRLEDQEREMADSYGARNALLVPLTFHEQVVGVVLVDDPGQWLPFAADEVQLIEGIAAQAAVAIENARLYEAQKHIADQLQRAIMEMPAQVHGLDFSHLYRSATDEAIVGGDFYDVFERSDGDILLLAGDVSGHGVNAARVATMVKASLVAFAQGGDEPGEVLTSANRLLMRKRVPGFTSVLLAVFTPATGTLRYCSAGHPNLLVGHLDGSVGLVGRNHTPLGIFTDWSCTADSVTVQPGETLLFYTDGLTEARRETEIYGEARLAASFSNRVAGDLQQLPQGLLEDALAFSGGRLQDDVAILAARAAGLPS
jgi:PAS domain S-box-containing protein